MEESELKSIVARVLNIDVSEVVDDLARNKRDEWDSFAHLVLIDEIEKSSSVKFSSSEIESVVTFKDLKAIIKKKA